MTFSSLSFWSATGRRDKEREREACAAIRSGILAAQGIDAADPTIALSSGAEGRRGWVEAGRSVAFGLPAGQIAIAGRFSRRIDGGYVADVSRCEWQSSTLADEHPQASSSSWTKSADDPWEEDISTLVLRNTSVVIGFIRGAEISEGVVGLVPEPERNGDGASGPALLDEAKHGTDVAGGEIRNQGRKLLELLARALEARVLPENSPLHFTSLEDGSVALEWLLDGRRLGFGLELEARESSWFYATSPDRGGQMGSGQLWKSDPEGSWDGLVPAVDFDWLLDAVAVAFAEGAG